MKSAYALGIILVAIVVIVGVFFGLNNSGYFGAGVGEGVIKFGYIGPLTGEVANIGAGQEKAIQIAVDEINSNGGINGRKVSVIFEDGKCNGKDAALTAQKLINVDKVKYIIGGQCSSESLVIAPLAESSKVLMISAISSNPKLTDSGDYIFRVYPSDSYQGKIAADYIYSTLKKNRAAVLSCLEDWCVGLKKEFIQDYTKLGGIITTAQDFAVDTKDLRTELTAAKQSGAQIIYLPSRANGTIVAFKDAQELGLNILMFGGDAWEDTTIWNTTKGFSDGAMYTVPKSDAPQILKTKILAKYGKGTDLVLGATQNYDIVNLLAQAINVVGDDSTKVKNYLYTMPPYHGISGTISFDENGDLKGATFEIKEIVGGEAQVKEVVSK